MIDRTGHDPWPHRQSSQRLWLDRSAFAGRGAGALIVPAAQRYAAAWIPCACARARVRRPGCDRSSADRAGTRASRAWSCLRRFRRRWPPRSRPGDPDKQPAEHEHGPPGHRKGAVSPHQDPEKLPLGASAEAFDHRCSSLSASTIGAALRRPRHDSLPRAIPRLPGRRPAISTSPFVVGCS